MIGIDIKDTELNLMDSIANQQKAIAKIVLVQSRIINNAASLYKSKQISCNQLKYLCVDVNNILSDIIIKQWLLLDQFTSIINVKII